MNPVSVSFFVFACAFGSALFGLFIKRLLPARHIGPESKDVVRVGMGPLNANHGMWLQAESKPQDPSLFASSGPV